MAITNLDTANGILNRVAVEVGLSPVTDPFSSDNPNFVKLKYFLNIAGEELVEAHTWEQLQKHHQIITADGDTGDYPLPDDFAYMINQTGWEKSQRVPLGGPLSAQDWAYLDGRNLVTSSIYASFRLAEGMFRVFPQPPHVGLDINFDYMSNSWVRSSTQPYTFSNEVTEGGQTPIFHKTLISRYVKLKYLDSGGFDTTKAQDDFNMIFAFITGTEKGAPVLNAGRSGGIPLISIHNLPDSGYGVN